MFKCDKESDCKEQGSNLIKTLIFKNNVICQNVTAILQPFFSYFILLERKKIIKIEF